MNLLVEDIVDFDQLVADAEKFVERRNPEALPVAEKLMKHALQSGIPRHFAQANYIFAFYNCLVANDYDKAITFCEEVLSKVDEDEIAGLLYKIYMTLGNSYQLKGEVFSAQESYMQGLKQLEARTELNQVEKKFLASFYYNLSLLLSNSELNISAVEYVENAIRIYTELDYGFQLSKSYMAYANIFERKGDYDKAIELLNKSYEIDLKANEPYNISLSKANLGILHLRIRDFEKAYSLITDALDYYKENRMIHETALVKINMGEVLYAVGKKKEGLEELKEAEKLFEALDNKRELTHIYQLVAKFMAQDGNYKLAFDYQQKYTDSLRYFFNVEKTNALTRAKKEFESEQREKETAILREKNEEIKHYVYKLERSNNELKQFAHVASHDLREPLRMISSYMALLQKTLSGLNDQQKEFIGFALDGAKRMEQLIHDLLRLAKVDANPRIEKVKLGILAEEVRMNLEVLVKEKNALVLHKDLPEIMADRSMMLQLMQNITGNGIKYNEDKQPTIRIRHRILKDGVELTIADNGIGIPEHLREKAFQIFQRLPTNKAYSGSGIGLAICKKIVESLGGKIFIEDNPGGGTIFRMLFPLSVLVKE